MAYVTWLGEKHFKLIWLNVDARMERFLQMSWVPRALSATADQHIRCNNPPYLYARSTSQ